MKSHRATIILSSLFLAGLLGLWLLELGGVPTEAQRRANSGRVIPELMSVNDAELQRVEIHRGEKRFRFERRGRDAWQLTEPLDVAADPILLESLVRNLKDLRPSDVAGTIAGPPEQYGLSPARVVVRLWKGTDRSASPDAPPLLSLEIGNSVRGQSFVRQSGSKNIEVVESKRLNPVELETTDFRERNLLAVPSFQVREVSVRRGGLHIAAERSPSGRWHLSAPVAVPANGPKVESLVAGLSSVRVLDPPGGFVAENVNDLSPYGLSPPEATVAITSVTRPDSPMVLEIGKPVPGHADKVFARRADQDDVVWISNRFLTEIPDQSTTLRGQRITELNPSAVNQVQIDFEKQTFRLVRQGEGWELTSPTAQKADRVLVETLLEQLAGAQSSEFLEASRLKQPELDPAVMRIKLWLGPKAPMTSGAQSSPSQGLPNVAKSDPVLDLRIGRHDILRKSIYAQLEGDDVVLALPDVLLNTLPRNSYAFRDRQVLALPADRVSRVSLVRQGVTTELEPDQAAASPNRWRMVKPVVAAADMRAISQLLISLSDLRAEHLLKTSPADSTRFGLESPLLTLTWKIEAASAAPGNAETSAGLDEALRSGWLKLGRPVPDQPDHFYAQVSTQPFFFTLSTDTIRVLAAEFHDPRIFSFEPDSVRRLVFKLPGRSFGFVRRLPPTGQPSDWTPEAGSDPRDLDLSRFHGMVNQLAELKAAGFVQYEGPINADTGLIDARLVVELHSADGKPPQVLRLGSSREGQLLAASGDSPTGAVFYLPAPAWEALIQSLSTSQLQGLPERVFAP